MSSSIFCLPRNFVLAASIALTACHSSQLTNAFSSLGQNLAYQKSEKLNKASPLHAKRPENPIVGLFGDMASSLSSSLVGNTNADFNVSGLNSKLSSELSLSWEDIRSSLEDKQTVEEKEFRSNVEKGIGPPSPMNKVRLFDEGTNEDDIRVTLYRYVVEKGIRFYILNE